MAGRVCPLWVGYILSSPLRRLFQYPKEIVEDLVKPGMTVLDVGCAMGFFSLAMAKMVGPDGRVISVDIQAGMIESLKRRAARAGLSDHIDTRICTDRSLEIDDLTDQLDFVLAVHVVHEVPDVPGFMNQVYNVMKRQSRLLVVEPKGHASADEYAATEAAAQQAGLVIVDHPKAKRDWATMFVKG